MIAEVSVETADMSEIVSASWQMLTRVKRLKRVALEFSVDLEWDFCTCAKLSRAGFALVCQHIYTRSDGPCAVKACRLRMIESSDGRPCIFLTGSCHFDVPFQSF